MDRCIESIVHPEKVKRAEESLPDDRTLERLVEIFKAMGDTGRIKIAIALTAGEMCVCDVSAVCGLSESAASHQLRILRNLKIVRGRREGKNMLYRLDDDHVDSLIRQSIYHVQENDERS